MNMNWPRIILDGLSMSLLFNAVVGLGFLLVPQAYRLMADAAPKYAHLYRAGIFGYIWLTPVRRWAPPSGRCS